MGRKEKIYALYKGDEFIDVGTIKEMAKRQGAKPRTLMYYQAPEYKRRWKDKERKELIKID